MIDENALHGSYVKIHTSVGTITLDGSILTFTDGMEGVFENAGFEVVSRQRRLQGVFELIGLFNSVPTFDGWNTTYDLPPKIPTTFEAEGHILYACQYGDSDLCDDVGLTGDDLVTHDDGSKHAKVEMKVHLRTEPTSLSLMWLERPQILRDSYTLHTITNSRQPTSLPPYRYGQTPHWGKCERRPQCSLACRAGPSRW